ncbi:MAG: filamentous hemagglutinin N-terminal domain-containing protein [Leptolyngbyaceae cyanobacterium RU_5_1]|nr:filamentous hemagglutinin N-terminal domain-containing protein [Leptolyngbyaceae cyanobacterium RU_5_1]
MKAILNHATLPALTLFLTAAFINSANAQINPAADGTGTVINQVGNTTNITGGTQAGSNLFHSFQKFGLNDGQTANFVSNPAIQNVLGRVTGGDPSVIKGLIQVTGGNSNLYLMNPAGIVFGDNASLNVPGSFVATTANGIGFRPSITGLPSQWFNAVGSNNYAALVGTPTHFAFTMSQPGAIVNSGNLAVGQGKSLVLLGGAVLNTGTLSGGTVNVTEVPGEKLVRVGQAGSLVVLELPLEVRRAVNPLPFTPSSLPQLLTGGNAGNATNLTVENGVVTLTGSGVTVPSQP